MDRVYDLIQETLAEVNRRWDLIGYSDETRMASIEAFTESIKCVCNEMVAQLQSEVASFELEEERTLDQIRHLALRLGDGEIELSDEVKALPWSRRLIVLRNHVQRLREQVGARLHTIEELHDALQRLWDDLGLNPHEDACLAEFAKAPTSEDEDVVLSLERIAEYERLIAEAQAAKQERTDKIAEMVLKLIDLWNLLEVAPSTAFDQSVLDGDLGCSTEVMKTLETRIKQLETEKERRECTIRDYGKKINTLWDKLHIPTSEREEFFDKATYNLGPGAIKSCEVELDRLEQLYKSSLKKLIEDARSKLLEQWNRLHVSKEERINFTPYKSEAYSEALLEAHQEEIEKNDQLLSTLEPILNLIEQRETILKQKVSFEQETADPKRLLSKERDPGRLLREEKMRKLLETKLPKIETDLVHKLGEWEAQSGKVFMFEGNAYLQRLQEQLEESSSKKKRKPLVEREPKDQSAMRTPSATKQISFRTPKTGPSSRLNTSGSIKRPAAPLLAPQSSARPVTPFATEKRAPSPSSSKRHLIPAANPYKPRNPLATIQGNPLKPRVEGASMKKPRLDRD